eukprot:6207662-Pleurochrysis_carterae.AAC.3
MPWRHARTRACAATGVCAATSTPLACSGGAHRTPPCKSAAVLEGSYAAVSPGSLEALGVALTQLKIPKRALGPGQLDQTL